MGDSVGASFEAHFGLTVRMASTASRFAFILTCEKRSSMARLRRPARAIMTLSGTPASAILVSAVCRRSWNRQPTATFFRRRLHAFLTLRSGGDIAPVYRAAGVPSKDPAQQEAEGTSVVQRIRDFSEVGVRKSDARLSELRRVEEID